MTKNPGGLRTSRLSKAFAKEYGYEFKFLEHGCTSMDEFCVLLPDIFSVVRDNQDCVVYPAATSMHGKGASVVRRTSKMVPSNGAILPQQNEQTYHRPLLTDQTNGATIPKIIQDRIKKTLVAKSKGIHLSEFNSVYMVPTESLLSDCSLS